jgi:hypothetical protein
MEISILELPDPSILRALWFMFLAVLVPLQGGAAMAFLSESLYDSTQLTLGKSLIWFGFAFVGAAVSALPAAWFVCVVPRWVSVFVLLVVWAGQAFVFGRAKVLKTGPCTGSTTPTAVHEDLENR